jgi:hypothetical protein
MSKPLRFPYPFPKARLKPDGKASAYAFVQHLHLAANRFLEDHSIQRILHRALTDSPESTSTRTPEEWFELFVEYARPRKPPPKLSPSQKTLLLRFPVAATFDLQGFWLTIPIKDHRSAVVLEELNLILSRDGKMRLTKSGLSVWKEFHAED